MTAFWLFMLILVAVGLLVLIAAMAVSPAFFEHMVGEFRDLGSATADACLTLWFYPGRLWAAYHYKPQHTPAEATWRMWMTWSG